MMIFGILPEDPGNEAEATPFYFHAGSFCYIGPE